MAPDDDLRADLEHGGVGGRCRGWHGKASCAVAYAWLVGTRWADSVLMPDLRPWAPRHLVAFIIVAVAVIVRWAAGGREPGCQAAIYGPHRADHGGIMAQEMHTLHSRVVPVVCASIAAWLVGAW